MIAVVGPNGSGKTTLLHFLSGLLEKDSGSIAFNGQEVNTSSREWKYKSAFVLEDGGTIPLLTVEEQLFLAGTLSGLDPEEAVRRREILIPFLGIEDHREHRGDELSSGLRKRLGLGIGIIRKADVFLFDEPFGSLDIDAAAVFIRILEMLKNKGRIVIFSTHTFPFNKSLCTRVWRLSQGIAEDLVTLKNPGKSLFGSLGHEESDQIYADLPWLS